MDKPLVISAANIEDAPKAKEILENSFRVKYVAATTEALEESLPDAEAYFAALEVRLTKDLIDKAPKLKAICTASTGTDHIDLKAAQQRDISVLCLKNDRQLLDQITSTAEMAWTLVLSCVRRIPEAIQASRNGIWARNTLRGHQIAYKTLGILGCGRLGTIVSQYAQAFRMRVIGHDKLDINVPGVEMVSYEQLLKESDILSIHIHLTEENTKLIGRDTFAKMKPGVVLINTSRGAIIDEDAMIEALENGTLSAAGLDVIHGEWMENLIEHPLIAYSRTHENLVITPHLGGVTYEGQDMAYAAAAQKLVNYLKNC